MPHDINRFSPADDLVHDLTGVPHGRESLFFLAPIPEEGLLINCYAWRTGETGLFGRFVAIAGTDPDAPVHFDAVDGVELQGDDLDDCSIGGLGIRLPTPLEVAELSYAKDGVTFGVRFEGLHAPFSYHDNAAGLPAYIATDRFEQSCRITGTLTIGDRRIDVDTFGQRDHSWGPRDWRALLHWKWINASAGGDLSLHAFVGLARGRQLINGYVQRDGVVTPIVDAKVDLDVDGRLMHQGVRMDVTDEDGRETTFEATSKATWPMPIGHLYLNEAACTARIDDRVAVAHVEVGWPKPYVDAYLEDPA